MNQRELARGLGLSPAAVCRAIKRGMPSHSVDEARAWRARSVAPYARSETAGSQRGPLPSGEAPARSGLNLADERAALAREQRLQIEMKNAVARGEYAPRELLARLLATASTAVVAHLEQLPGRIKRTCPALPARAIDEVVATVNAARNEWVRATAELCEATIVNYYEDEAEGSADAAQLARAGETTGI